MARKEWCRRAGALSRVEYDIGASLFMKGKRDADRAAYTGAIDSYTRYLATDPMAPGIADAIRAMQAEVVRLEAKPGAAPSEAIRQLAVPDTQGFVVLLSQPAGATIYIDDSTHGPVGVTPWLGTIVGEHKSWSPRPDARPSRSRCRPIRPRCSC